MSFGKGLTLYQTTKSRRFEAERADKNFKSDENGRKFSERVEKHCGKRRNCLLRAITPFPIVFLKRRVLQTCKNQALFEKGLTLYHTIPTFNDPEREGF